MDLSFFFKKKIKMGKSLDKNQGFFLKKSSFWNWFFDYLNAFDIFYLKPKN